VRPPERAGGAWGVVGRGGSGPGFRPLEGSGGVERLTFTGGNAPAFLELGGLGVVETEVDPIARGGTEGAFETDARGGGADGAWVWAD
jgi:hypothetical protein